MKVDDKKYVALNLLLARMAETQSRFMVPLLLFIGRPNFAPFAKLHLHK